MRAELKSLVQNLIDQEAQKPNDERGFGCAVSYTYTGGGNIKGVIVRITTDNGLDFTFPEVTVPGRLTQEEVDVIVQEYAEDFIDEIKLARASRA